VTAGGRTYLVCSLTLLLAGCSPTGGAAPSSATQAGKAAGTAAPAGSTQVSDLHKPFGIAVEDGSVWTTEYERGNLVRIDPGTSRVVARRHIGVHAAHIVADGGFIWVSDDLLGSVISVDEKSGTISRDIPLRQNFDLRPSAIAAGGDSVWVTMAPGFEHPAAPQIPPGQLVRIDMMSKSVVATIPIRGVATGVAVGGGGVWVASVLEPAAIYRIDPATNRVVATIATGHSPTGALAFEALDLWVANQDGYLTRIDSRTNQVVGNFEVGSPEWPALVRAGTRPQEFALLGNNLWVANYLDGTAAKLPIN